MRSITDHCGKAAASASACLNTSILPARIRSSTAARCTTRACAPGRFLADAYPVEADVVIGVPDSGLDAAIGYAQAVGHSLTKSAF